MARAAAISRSIGQSSDARVWSLERAITVMARELNLLNRTTRASLQQFYTLEQLEQRWQLGRDQTVALLAQHCGYRGARGHRPRVHLDHVLAIDEILRTQPAADAAAPELAS